MRKREGGRGGGEREGGRGGERREGVNDVDSIMIFFLF